LLRRPLLYVADTISGPQNPGVTVYPERGIDQRKIGSITNGVKYPTGLAVDTSENLYVGNSSGSTVTVYPYGSRSPSETLTSAGVPYGVAVGRDGTVYVANEANKSAPPSILVYPKGQRTPSRTIHTKGSPYELALDSFDNLYVTVGMTVYEFARGSSHGKALLLQGPKGELTGVAFDKRNDLLVLENRTNAHEVLVYPYAGTRPSHKIPIDSSKPVIGIAIDPENTEIWVTTYSGSEVQGISYPGGKQLDVLNTGGLATGIAVSPASND
jgi:sugar lactone lactonase YvrE